MVYSEGGYKRAGVSFHSSNHYCKKTSFEDIVIPVDTEKFVPVNAVWGFEKQVILSDIYIGKKEKADYVGFLCKNGSATFLPYLAS